MKQQLWPPQPPFLEVQALLPGAFILLVTPSIQVHHLSWLPMGIALASWPVELQIKRLYNENQSQKGQGQGNMRIIHRLSEIFLNQ